MNKHEDRHDTTDASKILKQRATVYGTYKDGVECRATILDALEEVHKGARKFPMSLRLRVMFSDLVLKLMRAASNPEHIDSWVDLEGYAKLIKEEMINDNNTEH